MFSWKTFNWVLWKKILFQIMLLERWDLHLLWKIQGQISKPSMCFAVWLLQIKSPSTATTEASGLPFLKRKIYLCFKNSLNTPLIALASGIWQCSWTPGPRWMCPGTGGDSSGKLPPSSCCPIITARDRTLQCPMTCSAFTNPGTELKDGSGALFSQHLSLLCLASAKTWFKCAHPSFFIMCVGWK